MSDTWSAHGMSSSLGKTPDGDDTNGAAIHVDDAIPRERVIAYDLNNPCMDVGTVTVLTDHHECTSSSRRRITTPTSKWVASKLVPILRQNPDSTALNGRWPGHLAAAIAIDGHNWMYPLAFGFIDVETEDNWEWNAYRRIIKPLGDKSYWPHVDLPWVIGAPLPRRAVGRYRKLRIKSCLEGGGGKAKSKTAANETDKGKKQMIRGKRKCKGCGELGHGQTCYKCPLDGTKKRQSACKADVWSRTKLVATQCIRTKLTAT
ncbi:hypothetical protein E2562_033897 [Oryza meyeriana var. granulata]|uniref:Uncharacterized protein n=1 Tax=Oryza meyeriana var. granulata TaxID=110450 RepID=A0A6G1BQ09_9ORYZ|nr:hypothetical protein E2562_033897 [Oryza meyeriana var. granulata]